MNKNFTPPRHFNDIEDCGSFIIKSSINLEKITAEINFYENLAPKHQRFFPKYLGKTETGKWPIGYKLEKIPNNDLSFYYTNNQLDRFDSFFRLIHQFIKDVDYIEVNESEFISNIHKNIIDRNLSRCHSLKSTTIFEDVNIVFVQKGFPNVFEYVEKLNSSIINSYKGCNKYKLWYCHGDLCLSNIIIHENKLFLLDPRGFRIDLSDLLLCIDYDLAKLTQCFFGGYDFINHNKSEFISTELRKECTDFITELGSSLRSVRLIEASHFLAMLPLHINSKEKIIQFANRSIDIFKEVN